MDWATLGWSSAQHVAWLRGLPDALQKQLQAHVPAADVMCAPPRAAPPWDMASGPVTELLSELGLLKLYGETFAEYELTVIGQLTADGPEAMEATLRELGVTRDHRDKLVLLAFSPRPCGSSGGVFSRDFLTACRPAHAAAMGAENLGPLLYSLLRFVKPRHVVEVGAGYTSLWLLQALSDNAEELRRCASAVEADGYLVGTPPHQAEWLLPPHAPEPETDTPAEGAAEGAGAAADGLAAFGGWAGGSRPLLHTIDSMSHEHTTAHVVCGIARDLGLSSFLELVEADAYTLPTGKGVSGEGGEGGNEWIDLLWLDFGVGVGGRLATFLEGWWPRIRSGGLLLVHSTLTNAVTRAWLDGVRARRDAHAAGQMEAAAGSAAANALGGELEMLSFREPHKKWQNSISIFQKRASGWAEPVLTSYP